MPRRRIFWSSAGAVLALGLGAIVVVHLPPVRARVLAAVLARLGESGIVARAERLDYNLIARTIDLYGVTLANAPSAEPFFSAAELHASLAPGIVRGRADLTSVEIVRPRVALLTDASGRTNFTIVSKLPPSGNIDMPPVRRLQIRDLGVLWHDARNDTRVEAAVSIDLTPDKDKDDISGPIAMSAPTHVRARGRETAISSLAGRLTWNNRDLSVRKLLLQAPEGTVRLDGRIDRVVNDPRLDLHVVSDDDLAALSPWLQLDRPLTGVAHVEADVSGPAGGPETTIRLTGKDAGLPTLPATVDAALHIAGTDVELTAFRANVADGTIVARGRTSFDGKGAARVEWDRVALPRVLRALDSSPGAVPTSAASGSVDASWTAFALDRIRAKATTRIVGRSGLLPVDGVVAVNLEDGAWDLGATDVRVRGGRAEAAVRGRLNAADLMQSSLDGSARVSADDAAELVRTLRRAGVLTSDVDLAGKAAAELALGGTIGAPSIEGSIDAAGRYGSLPSTTVHARASIAPAEMRLTEIDVRLGASVLRGAVQWSRRSDAIAGTITASISASDAASLAASLPPVEGEVGLAATLSGTMRRPAAAVSATSTHVAIAGQQVDALDAAVRIVGSDIAVDRLVLKSGDGRLEASGAFNVDRQSYAAHVTATGVPVRPLVATTDAALPISARVSGRFDGTGSLGDLGGEGRVSIVDARWDAANIGRLDSDVTLKGRAVSLVVDAPDLALHADGSVGVDPHGPVSAQGRWEPHDLAALAQRLGLSIPFSSDGSAAARFSVSGTTDGLDALKGLVEVDALDTGVGGQPFRLVRPGSIAYDGRVARADRIVLATGTTTLSIDGALGSTDAQGLSVDVNGSLTDFQFVRDLLRPPAADGEAIPPPAGSIQLHLGASGSMEQPWLTGTFLVQNGVLPITPHDAVTGIGLRARYDAGVLTVENVGAAFRGAALAATGRVPSQVIRDEVPPSLRSWIVPASGPATLSARITSLSPEIAAPFVDPAALEDIAGRIDASIAVEADRPSLDRLRGTIAIDRADLSLAGVSLNQQQTTRLAIADGRISVQTWDWGRDDNRVVVRGGATLGNNPALDVVTTAALDLRLVNAFVADARVGGRADAEIRLGGTAREPTLDGHVTVSNAEARIANPRIVVSDAAGTVTFTGDTLTVEHVSATVNGGQTDLAGSLRYRGFTPLDGQITLTSTGAALDLSGLRAEADARIALTVGAGDPAVSGVVTLQRSAFQEQLSLTGGLLRALQASSRPVQTAGSAIGSIRLDVRVTTQEDLLVDNNYGQLTARADLRAVGMVARPSVTGRIVLNEGGAVFFGANRYRLDEQGVIDFANPAVIEPDLTLSAVTRVRGHDIRLALKGTPATMKSELTSEDPQLTQSDLVSLLVTGRTASEAAASGYTPGSDELLGFLSGELFGTAGRAIGLDTVRVERGTPDVRFDAGLVAAETDPGARLTFGKNVGSKTEVVFSQSLQQSGGLTWIVSYLPRANVNVRVVSLDNGDRLYDFRHDLTFGAPRRAAQRTTPPAPIVSSVAISGAGADEAALRSHLKLSTGKRFSYFVWQDDRERIERVYHDRGHFEARVGARRIADGAEAGRVGLAYDIRPGLPTSVAVDGFALSASTIRTMDRAWMRAVVDEFLTEEVGNIARAELSDAGFLLPNVSATIERGPAAKRLHVTIVPGPHARSRRIEIDGNANEPRQRLLAVLADREISRDVWIDPNRARDALVAFYRSKGYLDASVRFDAITYANDEAVRPVHVTEGAVSRIREIRIAGAQTFTAEDLRHAAALRPGDAFTEGRIDEARIALDGKYRAQGFNRVALTLQSEKAGDAQIDVSIRVDEGPRQRLAAVATTGLERTRPALVARALKLEIGEPVNLADWNAARRRLYETGAFRSVDIQRETIDAQPAAADAPAAEEPVRAVVTVQEWPRLRVRYGFELDDRGDTAGDAARSFASSSTENGGRTFDAGVAGELGWRNLFGRAVSAGVAARYTTDFRAARLYGTSPAFFGLPLVSNVFLEQSHESLAPNPVTGALIAIDRTTLTLEQRVRPRARVEVTYRYKFERNHTFKTNPGPDDIIPFDIRVRTSRVGSSLVVDTRDDLVDSTRGWFHSSTLDYAPPSLGSDVPFVKFFSQHRSFHRTRSVVFASYARLGLATAFDRTLIPTDRFFAGGGNSVRGYAEDALSPLDITGDIGGGNALAVLNQEVRFPIFKMVRGLGFLDAGRAFDEVRSLSLTDLSTSGGFGLRVQTPVILLRIDYGYPFDARPGPRSGRWFFSIGQMF